MKKRKFTVITGRNTGMFSNMLHIIQQLYKCEKGDSIPIVVIEEGIYDTNGKNLWDFFFDPTSLYSVEDILETDDVTYTNKYCKNTVIYGCENCFRYKKYVRGGCVAIPSKECRFAANKIINKYIKLNDATATKVENFANTFFDGKILGVHIRYSKSHYQRERQGNDVLKRFKKNIEKHLCNGGYDKVFIATDCEEVILTMKDHFGDKVVYYDSYRAKSGELFDSKELSNIKTVKDIPTSLAKIEYAEEALIESYLLSKTDKLLHGISNLSSCVQFLNPDMDAEFIPKYNKEYKNILSKNFGIVKFKL